MTTELSNKSVLSTATLSKYKQNHQIPFRLEFVKELLKDNILTPMVNFDNIHTENFAADPDTEHHDIRLGLNKKFLNFVTVMNTLGGEAKYIKSGTTGHTFMGIIKLPDNELVNFGLKVVAYPKKEHYGDIYDARRPENAELMMIKLLSYFVVKKKTPHIVLPIGTFNTDIKNFVGLIEARVIDKTEERYVEFMKKYQQGYYHDTVSILVSEWANRGDLLDFLKQNYTYFQPIHWKVIFFQLLVTLAIIQAKFPAFRHNDLKANNILVEKINITSTSKKFRYTVGSKQYHIPNIGYIIKLWDFDFACIPGYVDNAKVSHEWTDAINIGPVQNRYYDMHYFFNILTRKGFFPQLLTESTIPNDVKEFIGRVVPPKYREGQYVHKRGRILVNDEYLTPEIVIDTDPYFEEFRKGKRDVSSSFKVVTEPKKEIGKKRGMTSKPTIVNLNDLDNVKLIDILGE
jgi:serine/threonine protein kinase